ncbi:MAG: hypothetical protein K2M83_08245 [Muribaculaceae bacterium]|nr:hypothetical protein [Muribaculaceae bacterium]
MKRLIFLLMSVVVAVAAFAFDFTGKTFRGNGSMGGTKVTVTYRFKANNRMTGTIAIQGQKPDTDSGMHWEISGDYMNIYDSTGDRSYMEISESDGKPILIAFDSYGNEAMVFKQVQASPASKKSSSKKR